MTPFAVQKDEWLEFTKELARQFEKVGGEYSVTLLHTEGDSLTPGHLRVVFTDKENPEITFSATALIKEMDTPEIIADTILSTVAQHIESLQDPDQCNLKL